MKLENMFSWSKSREEQFQECPRKYYYDKYASWGGWERGADPKTRLTYVLKNLKNRWAWKGETVHHVIERILKELQAGKDFPLERALEELTKIMRCDFRSSKDKKYYEDPKRNFGLFEHEYQRPVSDEAWKRIHDESAQCLRNFYGSPLYAELAADDKASWLVIEDLEEFDLDGTRVFVKLDFARRKGDQIEIYDWKTGKRDTAPASVQIGVYAIYAMRRWGAALDRLRAFLLPLGTGNPVLQPQALTQGLIQETRGFVESSAARMRALLADPARNIPKPREEFAFTSDMRLCDSCNFYKICEKYNPAY